MVSGNQITKSEIKGLIKKKKKRLLDHHFWCGFLNESHTSLFSIYMDQCGCLEITDLAVEGS